MILADHTLILHDEEHGQRARFPLIPGGIIFFYCGVPEASTLHQHLYEGAQVFLTIPNRETALIGDVLSGKCVPSFSISRQGDVEMKVSLHRDGDGVAVIRKTASIRGITVRREEARYTSGGLSWKMLEDAAAREPEWADLMDLVRKSMFVRASSNHQNQGDYWATDTETWCDTTLERCYPGAPPPLLWGEKEHADMAEASFTASWASRTPRDGLLIIDDFGATLSEEVAGALLQAIRKRCAAMNQCGLILTTSNTALTAAIRGRIPFFSWKFKWGGRS